MTTMSKRAEIVKKLNEQYGENFEDRDIRFDKNGVNWVDETNLPKKKNGKTINWKESIGCIVPFGYYGEIHEFKVLEYIVEEKKYMLLLQREDEVQRVPLSCVKNIELAKLFSKIREEEAKKLQELKEKQAKELELQKQEELEAHRLKRTQEVIDALKEKHPNTIVKSEFVAWDKDMKLQCAVCNHSWDSNANNLLKGCGGSCKACRGLEVNNYDQRNAIYYTHPHIARCLVNIQDAFTEVLTSSEKTLEFICRDCGTFHEKTKGNVLYTNKVYCDNCSDGVKYPNKFIFSVISQLSKHYDITEIKREFSPEWANGRLYDIKFKFDNKYYIVEMDGGFHFEDNGLSGQTVEESQHIDMCKDFYAVSHRYEIIRIDCYYDKLSERFSYIRGNIIQSELSELFDLSYIDWNEVNKFSVSSLVVMVWDMINNNDCTVCDVQEKFHISKSTVLSYMKLGKECGVIDVARRLKRKEFVLKKLPKQKPHNRDSHVIYVFKNGKLAHEKSFANAKRLRDESEKIFGEKFSDSKTSVRLNSVGVGEHTYPFKGYSLVKIPYGRNIEDYMDSIETTSPIDDSVLMPNDGCLKKVYLEDVFGTNSTNKYLNWEYATNKDMRFNYNGVFGVLTIKKYIKVNTGNNKLLLNAYGYEFVMDIGNLRSCKFRGHIKEIFKHMIKYKKQLNNQKEVA